MRGRYDSMPAPAITQYTTLKKPRSDPMMDSTIMEPASMPWNTVTALRGSARKATPAMKPTTVMPIGSSVQRSMRLRHASEKCVVKNMMARPMNAPDAIGTSVVKSTMGSCSVASSMSMHLLGSARSLCSNRLPPC